MMVVVTLQQAENCSRLLITSLRSSKYEYIPGELKFQSLALLEQPLRTPLLV